MSIRVQCGKCGSAMSVRDEYAGTERRCPKCQGKFTVPPKSAANSTGSGESPAVGAAAPPAEEEFDAIAFLTGETPAVPSAKSSSAAKTSPASKSSPANKPVSRAPAAPAAKPASPADFDPLDVLGSGPAADASTRQPAPGKSGESKKVATPGKSADTKPPAAPEPAAAPDFDPLDVLAAPAKPAAPAAPPTKPAAPAAPAASAQPAAPPAASPPAPTTPASPAPAEAAPEKPQPRRPSWAKPPPQEENRDWEEPQPEKPAPKRPAWAKPAPAEEDKDWEEPQPDRPQPKRPAWAKPLPDEKPAVAPAAGAVAVAADASPAAQAAAAAMSESVASVSAENPALQEAPPKGPLIDVAAIKAAFRRRLRLMITTAITALALFGVAWAIVSPHHVDWYAIGTRNRLMLVPISGQVTSDSKPVVGARIVFHPRGAQFRSPEGVTDSEGRYTVYLCEGVRGAPAGRYRVQVQLIGPNGRDAIPSTYGQLTQQQFEVKPGGGPIDIRIDTAPPKTKPN